MERSWRVMIVTMVISIMCASLFSVQAAPEGKSSRNPGLKTKLIPLESKYIVGKPMKFRVDLTNIGTTPAPYNLIATASCWKDNPLMVTGPDGKSPQYIGPLSNNNTIYFSDDQLPKLQPNAVVTIFKFDLARYYDIQQPGSYTVQYGVEYEFPNSNIVNITVYPGASRSPPGWLSRWRSFFKGH